MSDFDDKAVSLVELKLVYRDVVLQIADAFAKCVAFLCDKVARNGVRMRGDDLWMFVMTSGRKYFLVDDESQSHEGVGVVDA